ncbi:unnamed protein product [Cyprideis torosa]|uniref:Uncharacterized protein n=1 Tax=Cyprideis torosa TaxID=163714 RepID=A0A7R8WA79_9CRUS|nr:unnamed protein product [Cyprideis torosa]CAG0890667.1 unnamed protein product [Cyprideis torosa]
MAKPTPSNTSGGAFTKDVVEDHFSMEDDFLTWKDLFWSRLCEKFGLEQSLEEMNMRQFKCTIHEEGDPVLARLYTGEVARLKSYVNQRPPYDSKNPYLSPILEHRELHKGGDRSCMHLEFGTEGTRMRYESGEQF